MFGETKDMRRGLTQVTGLIDTMGPGDASASAAAGAHVWVHRPDVQPCIGI